MKRNVILAAAALCLILAGGVALAQQQGYGQGYGQQSQCWYGQGKGHGHMQSWQGQVGAGMKSQQWGRGQYGPGSTQPQMEPLSRATAQELAKNYVAGNPNLKVGGISEQDEVYLARIFTQDDSLVEKLVIDKRSGWMRKEY